MDFVPIFTSQLINCVSEGMNQMKMEVDNNLTAFVKIVRLLEACDELERKNFLDPQEPRTMVLFEY